MGANITGFNSAVLSVISGVFVDSETHVVTSSISRFTGPTQFFEGSHRSKLCVRPFIEVRVRSCI